MVSPIRISYVCGIGTPIVPSHKSHNASDNCHTMHHFVTWMCTHVHISVAKWCIVVYEISALWGMCNRSIQIVVVTSGLILALHPAYERRRYKVTPSLIGWAQTYNHRCNIMLLMRSAKWEITTVLQCGIWHGDHYRHHYRGTLSPCGGIVFHLRFVYQLIDTFPQMSRSLWTDTITMTSWWAWWRL